METFEGLDQADLEALLRIRAFETNLLELFSQGQIGGTTHTCLGQEYIPVALKTLIRPSDFVFSNHRGHGHYLAQFNDVRGLLAEIAGREGAVCLGVGGSQHIYRPGSYLSTGIQGECLAVAAGVAFHFKRRGASEIAVVYIGDGTWGEGIVYESLNLAALWRLPLVIVVENNGIAQSTPIELQMAGTIEGRVRGFGIRYERIATMDINEIRRRVAPLILSSRMERVPLVLEFETFRLGPHSKGDDTRTADEKAGLKARDIVARYAETCPHKYAEVWERVEREIKADIREVLSRGPSVWA